MIDPTDIRDAFCEQCGARYGAPIPPPEDPRVLGPIQRALRLVQYPLRLCLRCGAYACEQCWNGAATACVGCVPVQPPVEIDVAPVERLTPDVPRPILYLLPALTRADFPTHDRADSTEPSVDGGDHRGRRARHRRRRVTRRALRLAARKRAARRHDPVEQSLRSGPAHEAPSGPRYPTSRELAAFRRKLIEPHYPTTAELAAMRRLLSTGDDNA